MTGISPNQHPIRGRDWTRKGGRNWKRFDSQSCIDPTHRKPLQRSRIAINDSAVVVRGAGDVVARRSLEFYDALGRVMAVKGNA
jgi:hypothetical protein